MTEKMERRRFLRFLSCAPIVGGGAVVAAAAIAQERRPDAKEPHLLFSHNDGRELHLSMGEAGVLWISDGKTWRKVAVE